MSAEGTGSKLNTFFAGGIFLILILVTIVLVSNQFIGSQLEKQAEEKSIEERKTPILPEATLELEEFLVSGTDRGTIKCRMQLTLSRLSMVSIITSKSAEIRDIIARVLTSYTAEEANEAFRTGKLHEAIMNALNKQFRDWFTTGDTFWLDNEVKKVLGVNFIDFYAR